MERILEFFVWVLNRWQNRESLKTLGAQRSLCWRKTREEHIRKHPKCEICLSEKMVEVHHLEMFSRNPARECDPTNLVSLCESGKNGVVCHRFFGHLGNYQKINPNCLEDIKIWHNKILNRI